ncbi:hypothetical protein B0H10DRAFT_2125246 [Mycena sp. CBHHK59/15]|nr:hypothetical protein B0H10DRAFT_2125246 [Mycena sp. CBHHK59/15]
MQLISALTSSLLALAMSISASPAKPIALTPDDVAAAGLTNIHDFQGNSLNLAGAANANGASVIGFPSSFDSAINQQWSFISQGSNFIIASGMNSSLFLSYPAAPFGGAPNQGGTVVFSDQFPAEFTLNVVAPPSPGISIVEVSHKQALTSWPAVPGVNESPVTFVDIDSDLQAEQTWTLVAAA